ncbi:MULTISPECIES: TetR/AcrR family transcriptional regulator [Glycomyces]|uniref:DNA-binding transcriptional regulator YbjK n=2 Tax=Glycomyces TaxID=58113 RepID=A0A9X3PP98_9ACTN|nr:TetR/AcrR family transcriptional regulator [Glycomyces lechevalierae]MDA1387770.1 TetR family transcriptional regulator [Glycomyces lechevalierae]MDR7337402.1 DNA-binding transcriptional regulator YbjK [Glycomyces lechevalierae]
MRQNPERRTALIDAAIEVLADQGARGLTFRAVDTQAGVPIGTASNYFANRDALLTQAGQRVFQRLDPGAEVVGEALALPRTRASVERLMHEMVGRITAFRSGFLAMLELRLEATRRPELAKVLTDQIRANLQENIDFHLQSGMPGDAETVVMLYLALNWLIVERLTLPEVFGDERTKELVTAAVNQIVPPR